MLRYLIEKEFKQLFRNAFIPRLIVLMPVMMMLVLPWAANQEVKDVKLCVVDHDHTAASVRLVEKVTASDYFILSTRADSYEEAFECVERGEADIILEIPLHFERKLNGHRDTPPQVYIAANAVNGTRGTIAATYLTNIVSASGASLSEKTVSGKISTAKPESVAATYRFNANLDYIIYMVPALMVMLLTLITGFLPALNIVSEKETGTIEQINVSPVGKLQFIMAKLIPYWIIGIFILTVCMGLGILVYDLHPIGSWGTIYFSSAIYILVVSGMGLIISNYSNTMQQAMFVMYFFIMILLLMSGLLTPVGSMPDWAQWIASVNPLKYFVEIMRAVYLKGSALADIASNLYALLAFAAVFNLWAMISYKKQE